jgi:hypothetical protein
MKYLLALMLMITPALAGDALKVTKHRPVPEVSDQVLLDHLLFNPQPAVHWDVPLYGSPTTFARVVREQRCPRFCRSGIGRGGARYWECVEECEAPIKYQIK